MTKTEAKRLGDAAMCALYRATEHDSKMEREIREAYAYERKGRSSAIYAQAAICEGVLGGMRGEYTVAGLFSLSPGCARAAIVGARLQHVADRNANVWTLVDLDACRHVWLILVDALVAAQDAARDLTMQRLAVLQEESV